MIEARRGWRPLEDDRAYSESDWKPDNWPASYRFLFLRRKVRRQIKGPLQLDLFGPRSLDHDHRPLSSSYNPYDHQYKERVRFTYEEKIKPRLIALSDFMVH